MMNKSCSFWKQPRMWVKVFKINVKEGKNHWIRCVCVCVFLLCNQSSNISPHLFLLHAILFLFHLPLPLHPSVIFSPSLFFIYSLLPPPLTFSLHQPPFFSSLPVSSPHPLLFSFSLIPSCSPHSLSHSSLSFLFNFLFLLYFFCSSPLPPSIPPLCVIRHW